MHKSENSMTEIQAKDPVYLELLQPHWTNENSPTPVSTFLNFLTKGLIIFGIRGFLTSLDFLIFIGKKRLASHLYNKNY